METNGGGTLIYIRNPLLYNTRNDLKIYKSFELEPTFNEICNPEKVNIIVGCIYKHPNMNINEFNDDYLIALLDKLSEENKTIFFLGDFNFNMLNYDIHPPTSDFVDLPAAISDHLPRFLVASSIFIYSSYPKSNNY